MSKSNKATLSNAQLAANVDALTKEVEALKAQLKQVNAPDPVTVKTASGLTVKYVGGGVKRQTASANHPAWTCPNNNLSYDPSAAEPLNAAEDRDMYDYADPTVRNIVEVKEKPVNRIVAALGVPTLGQRTTRTSERELETFEQLMTYQMHAFLGHKIA